MASVLALFALFSVNVLADGGPGGVQVVLDPEDPSLEIGGGAEFTGEKVIASFVMEYRGDVERSTRYVRVSTELGIEKDASGDARFRYAHVDITPMTFVSESKDFSLGLVPITLESEYGLGLESAYKVRLAEVSRNFGVLGLQPGFFANLSGKFLGYQRIRFLGGTEREGAFDFGTLSGDAGYTWSFSPGKTLRWKVIDASASYSSILREMDFRTQATFYLDRLAQGALTVGYKNVTNPNALGTQPSMQDQFYVRIGVGIVISGR